MPGDKLQMKQPSVSEPAGAIDLEVLQSICGTVRFAAGDVLRQKGLHYRNMYLITEGSVDVDLGNSSGGAKLDVSGAGSAVGEIGFLRGSPATATVTARTETVALVIDDSALARLEREQPAAAADLWRHLAETAEERTSYNLTWGPATASDTKPIEVYLCRNADMLEKAQRLRYEVYCQELGRKSPHADHDKKIITDHLDETGHTFIAVEGDETIGTLRGNAASECALGILEELYGMKKSPHHPAATAVCTKFIVRKSNRGGPVSIKLISAIARYALRNRIRECYIDCIPALLPYYKAIGFKITAPKFLHVENGPSHPMMIDLAKHGARLSGEGGRRHYLGLIIKAQFIKLIDRVREHKTVAPA